MTSDGETEVVPPFPKSLVLFLKVYPTGDTVLRWRTGACRQRHSLPRTVLTHLVGHRQRWNCQASGGRADPCTFPDRNSGPLRKNGDESNPLKRFATNSLKFPEHSLPGSGNASTFGQEMRKFSAWNGEFLYLSVLLNRRATVGPLGGVARDCSSVRVSRQSVPSRG